MESYILSRKVFILGALLVFLVYLLMLITDIRREDHKRGVDGSAKVFIEGVTLFEKVRENETLTISAEKLLRMRDFMEGENILLELKREEEPLLGVKGKRGSYEFYGCKATLEGEVQGHFGDLLWETPRLSWSVKVNEVVAEEGVRFALKGFMGRSSKMLVYPDKGVVVFSGNVEVVSRGKE